MSRRDQIKMSPEEVESFLHEEKTMSIATISSDGRPHVVAMWYAWVDGELAFWTFGKSQKVMNLRRDPRITCMVEAGDTYADLRGVELIAKARIVEDPAVVIKFGIEEFERYQGVKVNETTGPGVERMAQKRVVILIDVEKVVSWDHRKLGGTY
jgi:PPOX class probable F420-dependent enzyme